MPIDLQTTRWTVLYAQYRLKQFKLDCHTWNKYLFWLENHTYFFQGQESMVKGSHVELL